MKKILIIEDDPIIGKIYHSYFKKSGYEVELAADGQEGYYKIQQGKFDGLLLDLMLPHMSGVDILRKIRAQKSFQKLIVVVFTSSFMSEMFDTANESGANRIFHKSNLTPHDLVEVMNQEFFLASNRGGATGNSESEGLGQEATADSKVNDSYRQELIQTFLKKAPDTIETLENGCREFLEARNPHEVLEKLQELYRKLHVFSGVAGLAGLKRLGELCTSMEALLIEMHQNAGANTPSTRRTISQAIAFLKKRFRDLAEFPESADRAARVLVVDDELMSRRAASFALDIGGMEVATHDDPRASLDLLSKRSFHLVVLDESMAGLTGSQMLDQIHQGPPNQNTPAILILNNAEFRARAEENRAPNLDLIARPFPFSELAVKALSMMLNHQIVDMKPLTMSDKGE